MLVGYARVSTVDQTLALQQDALTKAGCTRIFTDTASGSRTNRTGLEEALGFLRDREDTLVVWRLDRLGRSLRHLIDTIGALQERGIGFKSLQEQIDTTTSGGKLVFHYYHLVLPEVPKPCPPSGELVAVAREHQALTIAFLEAAMEARLRNGQRPASDTDSCRIVPLTASLAQLIAAGQQSGELRPYPRAEDAAALITNAALLRVFTHPQESAEDTTALMLALFLRGLEPAQA